MSLLDSWRERRAEILSNQRRDLPVPRYHDPEVVLRIEPLDDETYRTSLGKIGVGAEDRIAHAARVIAAATVGIYLRDVDGRFEPAAPDGQPAPRFDDGTAAALVGAEFGEPAQLVRALFVTDADVAVAADAVLEFAGYGRRLALEMVAGESPATPR